MTDRVVTYDFRARMGSLLGGMTAGGRAIQGLGAQLTGLDKQGAKMRVGLDAIGSSAGRMGLVAAAGLGVFVAKAANFEQSMSNIAATGEEARGSLNALRQAALDAGASTAFSATESAAAIENLLKAGVSVSDVLGGGLAGALDLAAAGSIEVADAAGYAATAMTQFGLAGTDVPHVADLLSAAAGKATGEVGDFGAALNQAGLVADQVGLSIEETTGGLAAFANAGLLGSDAGTSFKTALAALTPNSAEAADLMKQLGINAFDAQGNFIGLAEFAGNLQGALAGMTDQQRQATLETIFGSDAVRAASILYEEGADGIQGWIDQVNDSGYAAEVAGIKMDNLKGDVESLGGALESAFIGLGSGSEGPLRQVVQGLTDTVNAFNELPGPLKTATTAGIAFAAVFGGGTFLTAKTISGLVTTREALTNLGVSADKANKSTRILGRTMGAAAGIGLFTVGMSNANETLGAFESAIGGALTGLAIRGPWGAAVGGIGGLLASLATNAEDTTAEVEALTKALTAAGGVIDDTFRQGVASALEDSGALKAAESLGVNLQLVTEAALGSKDALSQVNAELDAQADALTGAAIATLKKNEGDAAAMQAARQTIWDSQEQIDTIDKVRDAINGQNQVVDEATGKYQRNAAAMGEAEDSLEGLTEELDAATEAAEDLSAAMNQLAGFLDRAQAARDYAESVKAVGEAFKDGFQPKDVEQVHAMGREIVDLVGSLDKKPVQQRNALQQAKEQLEAFAASNPKAKAALDDLLKFVNRGLDAFNKRPPAEPKIDANEKPFEAKARAVNSKLHALGLQKVFPEVDLDISDVYKGIGLARAALNSINGDTVTTYIATRHLPQNNAAGGYIAGPGGPTEDKIPAMLSNGEYVVRAAAVDQYGVGYLDEINALRLARGGLATQSGLALAAGGSVTSRFDQLHLLSSWRPHDPHRVRLQGRHRRHHHRHPHLHPQPAAHGAHHQVHPPSPPGYGRVDPRRRGIRQLREGDAARRTRGRALQLRRAGRPGAQAAPRAVRRRQA